LAAQSKVVIATAGPFARYGTPIVDACVRSGADYCDVTGAICFHCTHSQQKAHGQDLIKGTDNGQAGPQIEYRFARIGFSRSFLDTGVNIVAQRANGCDIGAQSLPGHAVMLTFCWPAPSSACSGEVIWMRRILDKYHEAAKEKNVRIVHCCGFDSIPSDLGTCLVVDHLNSLGKYV